MAGRNKKRREFVLEIEDQNPPDLEIPTMRLNKVYSNFNVKCPKIRIVEYLVMAPVEDLRHRYKVFIGLSEKFAPVERDYFARSAYKGNQCFGEEQFKVITCSVGGCRVKFAGWKSSREWAFPEDADLSLLPDWVKEKEADAAKEVNLDSITEFTDNL